MNKYFAYIRVSTQKQGSKGVSLQEQRAAIEAHAEKAGLPISEWFEERETAAKTGRAQFTAIMKRLQKGEAAGLIIHKIDRSARNLKDWAALGELIDKGIDVQVASETYDLNSRGGRLSADIQAVIAADYIRNLREETIKGMRGRLKQGLYPLRAPVGYLDTGGGKPKTPDPVKAPLIRQAFELYAQGKHSLRSLEEEMHKRGLTSNSGKPLRHTAFSNILNNPFYAGTILVRTTGETFDGIHEPIIKKALFKAAQDRLQGKARKVVTRHGYIFARKFKCRLCNYSLIGERQKGKVYYRCHSKGCEMKSIREEELLRCLGEALEPYSIRTDMFDVLRKGYNDIASKISLDYTDQKHSQELQLNDSKSRLERLTDVYLDGDVSPVIYKEKRARLETKISKLSASIDELSEKIGQEANDVEQFLELAEMYISSAQRDFRKTARDLVDFATSNCTVSPQSVEISIDPGWLLFTKRDGVLYSGQWRNRPRTKTHHKLCQSRK